MPLVSQPVPLNGNGGTVTASSPLLNLTQTWNNAAVVFIGSFLSFTDTASDATSMIADWRVGNVTQFSLSKAGFLTCNNSISLSSTGTLRFSSSRSRIGSPGDGQLSITNAAGTAFTVINFGGGQKYYPTPTTVAALVAAATAGAASRGFVTDALGPTFGATVVGGGAVTVPVYSDGTNWKVG